METVTLPHRVGTPQPSMHTAVLPNILDPATAANVPVRHVCCIGAGYVGKLPFRVPLDVRVGAPSKNYPSVTRPPRARSDPPDR